MDKELKNHSICSTCNKADMCVHLKKVKQPILFCEEYDGGETHPSPAIQPQSREAEVPADERRSREYKGLCVNCDHRETCIHATREGGIWHCEEYQ
jgi:hypothetical protein